MTKLQLHEVQKGALYVVEQWSHMSRSYEPAGVEVRHGQEGFYSVEVSGQSPYDLRQTLGGFTTPDQALGALSEFIGDTYGEDVEDELG